MNRSKRAAPQGGGWQQWVSSMMVGLTLLVILLFLFQQLSEVS